MSKGILPPLPVLVGGLGVARIIFNTSWKTLGTMLLILVVVDVFLRIIDDAIDIDFFKSSRPEEEDLALKFSEKQDEEKEEDGMEEAIEEKPSKKVIKIERFGYQSTEAAEKI